MSFGSGLYGGHSSTLPLDTCKCCKKNTLVLVRGILVCPVCDEAEWATENGP